MIAGLFISGLLSAVVPDAGAEADRLINVATTLLLEGQPMSDEIIIGLPTLPAAERMKVLIFLRRSGLMTTPIWTVDRILAPAEGSKDTP